MVAGVGPARGLPAFRGTGGALLTAQFHMKAGRDY
jgi:hypothetical protein